MNINLSKAQTDALKHFLENCEDAEMLKDDEWILDLYESEPPMSLDMVILKNGDVQIDGAAVLSYDESLKGWYMHDRIESTETVLNVLVSIGALG